MNRRQFLCQSAFYPLLLSRHPASWSQEKPGLLDGGAREPIPEPHFPDRLHLFIWRNWELVNTDRLAQVLGATAEQVLEVGASMGLPKKLDLTEDQLRRIYITVIRQNWHILPHEQLIDLLGWDRARYEFTLKEDDFLWAKLGLLKPHCKRLKYETPSAEARGRAAEIKHLVRATFGTSLDEPGELPFAFIRELSSVQLTPLRDPHGRPSADEIDLTRGWTLIKPAERLEVPVKAMEEFHTYLRSAFGCEVNLAEGTALGPKNLQVSLRPSIGQPAGSFQVSVKSQEIRITASDVMGLRQALYYLKDQMEERQGPYLREGLVRRITCLDPRYGYSYFALYGDPLMDEGIDPFPSGFLDKLARAGVNGVWLQAVLRNLAPSNIFPEFGAGSETRLRNLAKLVERTKQYGVKIYLYLNEPRAMPAEFFSQHPYVKGTYDKGDPNFFAMCTSTQEVRAWLSDSLSHVFSQVPGLGGFFTITASENLTNCYSHGQATFCPRCPKRRGSEVIAEVIRTLRDGARRSRTTADIIAWDWGWGEDWVPNGANAAEVIQRLPADVSVLSVSEWDKPIQRGGVRTKVGEYSISVVGPGPRATRNWELARKRGLSTLAKVQWSNTWEISAVPYVPVPTLVAEHCENLSKQGVRGLMVSWTVGGYPSPNFEAAKEYNFSPQPQASHVLHQVAVRRYGKEAAPKVLDAWKVFGTAFMEYPMEGGGVVYHVPTQHGPANNLRLHHTGYESAMMLFPYDDYKAWVGSYPVDVTEKQFEKLARLWRIGAASFREALAHVPKHKQAAARKDLGIVETCYTHFRSVANQIRFYRLRDELSSAPQDSRSAIAGMIKIAEREIELAKWQYTISRRDSTIGYEASNHYYYRPLDLVEKVINCRHLIDALKEV